MSKLYEVDNTGVRRSTPESASAESARWNGPLLRHRRDVPGADEVWEEAARNGDERKRSGGAAGVRAA